MITSTYILEKVQKKFNVRNIAVKHRKGDYPYYRYIYFQLCRDLTNESFSSIGAICGKRDHSTVKNGCKKFEHLRELNHPYIRPFTQAYNELKLEIEANMKHAKSSGDFSEFLCQEDMKEIYKIKLWKIIQKNHSIIRKMNFFRNSKLLKKVYDLPEEEVELFESLALKFIENKKNPLK